MTSFFGGSLPLGDLFPLNLSIEAQLNAFKMCSVLCKSIAIEMCFEVSQAFSCQKHGIIEIPCSSMRSYNTHARIISNLRACLLCKVNKQCSALISFNPFILAYVDILYGHIGVLMVYCRRQHNLGKPATLITAKLTPPLLFHGQKPTRHIHTHRERHTHYPSPT